VNLRTGQVRRVPFRGPAGLGGCFSRDRRKVYVSGLDMQNGGLAIYEIDLSTGENRRIGEGALPDGMALMSALSGDGTTLAVLMFSPDLQSQLYLVDLAGDKARPLGRPMDTAFLSWLDDGQGLILVDRKMVSMDESTEDSVARMTLDGTVTVLVPGRHPVLIPRRGRILFQQDDGWKTSDLDGRNVELYAGGMKGYGFPAVSPDGTRLVWMRFETGKMPQPVIQTFGSTAVTELDLGPGLWAGPAWR